MKLTNTPFVKEVAVISTLFASGIANAETETKAEFTIIEKPISEITNSQMMDVIQPVITEDGRICYGNYCTDPEYTENPEIQESLSPRDVLDQIILLQGEYDIIIASYSEGNKYGYTDNQILNLTTAWEWINNFQKSLKKNLNKDEMLIKDDLDIYNDLIETYLRAYNSIVQDEVVILQHNNQKNLASLTTGLASQYA